MIPARAAMVLGVLSAFGTSALVLLGASPLLWLEGCGDAGPESPEQATINACEHTSTGCSNDVILASDTNACTVALDGPCAQATLLYKMCVQGKCTDAGFEDLGGIASACFMEANSLSACLQQVDTPLADAGKTTTSTNTASEPDAGATTADSGSTPVTTIRDAGAHD